MDVNLAYMIVIAMLAGMVGFGLGYLFKQMRPDVKIKAAEEAARKALLEAQAKAKEIVLEAKDESLKTRDAAEAEIKRRRQSIQEQEQRLQQRRENLDRRSDNLEGRQRKLEVREKELEKKHSDLDTLRQKQLRELERISGLSQDEARQLFLKAVEEESRQDAARLIREIEAQAKQEGEARAREIIVTAMQRIASEQVAESTVSLVPIPNDEMKGRIIGRSGRNIRAIELATGADLVVDDTPEAVTISCFDPIRREVARVALTKLVTDGRIHPGRVEKVVAEAQKEVEAVIQQEGERAAFEVGVPGLPPEIINLVGRLKFRTSYGQNQHAHAIETAHLAAMMAAEVKADVAVVKAGALLHDIGKAVSHEQQGAHALIGADIARRYGLPRAVVNCIAAHHGEAEFECLESILVQAADAISGARPGARRETLEAYLKRVRALEDLANAFPGVAQSYAIQAGREIRIIVKPEEIDDLAAINLSKNIARKVESSMEYPGQIKVTVIRETRAVEIAQ